MATTSEKGTVFINIERIGEIKVEFSRFNKNNEAKEMFNELYGECINEMVMFDTTGNNRSTTSALLVENVIQVLTAQIVDEIIVPYADETPGVDDAAKRAIIMPFFTNATWHFSYYYKGCKAVSRMDTTSVERSLSSGLSKSDYANLD